MECILVKTEVVIVAAVIVEDLVGALVVAVAGGDVDVAGVQKNTGHKYISTS